MAMVTSYRNRVVLQICGQHPVGTLHITSLRNPNTRSRTSPLQQRERFTPAIVREEGAMLEIRNNTTGASHFCRSPIHPHPQPFSLGRREPEFKVPLPRERDLGFDVSAQPNGEGGSGSCKTGMHPNATFAQPVSSSDTSRFARAKLELFG